MSYRVFLMKCQAGRAEDRVASATGFRVGFTHSIQVQTRIAIAAVAVKNGQYAKDSVLH